MAVAELLDPQPGERVLDLAAAPGGKATHIASLMRGQGLLIANEMHPKRAWDLAENLERWGARNAAITNEPPERLAERFPGHFDRVLLDAPCSGEGMFRKSEAARREWSPALVAGCAQRQSAILEHAAWLVRPGGRLVYSTCTFAPEEDEDVIARFLDGHDDFELTKPVLRPGFSPGRPEWLAEPQSRGAAGNVALTIRLWPHTGPGEGHFVAVLQRRPAIEPAAQPRLWPPVRLPRPVEQAYRAFCAAYLPGVPAAEHLALVGSYLYALPPELPDLSGLRFLHPGWWLGTIKKDRFEPSHALALGLKLEDAHRSVRLDAASPDLRAYLHGGGFRSPGDDSWLLVAVDGHPLGWGKRVNGTVKSHYPKGLRWN
jgi:NOL1/NOP2/fmu family ribosome biogenesis protein/precorrin-6B methylase 2